MGRTGKTSAASRPEGWVTVLLLVVGAFDGAAVGGMANQLGWVLHDNLDGFRWNTMGWLWAGIGAGVGMAVVGRMLMVRRVSSRHARWYAARWWWLRLAILAVVVRSAAIGDVVEILAAVTLAVAVTVGYFVEANALFRLSVERFRSFATLVGALLGAVVGALANSPAWFVGGAAWPVGGAVLGAVIGWFVWAAHPPTYERRLRIPERAAPAIFLAPALLFVGIALVVPTLRTIYLSFFDSGSDEFVGASNYRAIQSDSGVVNFDGFGNAWTGRLLVVGLLIGLIAVAVGVGRAVSAKWDSGWLRRVLVVVAMAVAAAAVWTAAALVSFLVVSIWWSAAAALVVLGIVAIVLAGGSVSPVGRIPWPSLLKGVTVVLAVGLAATLTAAGGPFAESRWFLAGAVLLVTVAGTVAGRTLVTGLSRDMARRDLVILVGSIVVLVAQIVVVRWLSLKVLSGWLTVGAVTAGSVAMAAAVIVFGYRSRRAMDLTGPVPTLTMTTSAAWVLIAAVSAFSGVLWNNIFWIVFVTGLATAIGLAIAVLADRARGESLAKSLIFMPMAISFVGASIIWRFIYAADSDIGLLNAAVVNMGGEPQLWIQERPWNTMFLIAIMIWIQTGFAMVIFSAAIKGVPEELREAARIDGAGEMATFWRVTLPHIRTTVVVVVTTLIVTVLKIYDLIQVMTGGRFGTNVLANQMFLEVFRFRDAGRGAALATLLFVGVVPLMIMNVRRVQRQEEVR